MKIGVGTLSGEIFGDYPPYRQVRGVVFKGESFPAHCARFSYGAALPVAASLKRLQHLIEREAANLLARREFLE